MMTLTAAITLLERLVSTSDGDDQRRYRYHLLAHKQVLHGKPYDETDIHHAFDRYAYREGWEMATLRKMEGV